MALPNYNEIVTMLEQGIYKITYLNRNRITTESYVTMNADLARLNGFEGFRLTPRRIEEDIQLSSITVVDLQEKKYIRIDISPGKVKSIKRFMGKIVPSKIKGYNVVQVSYEELLTMLIRGKLTVKFIRKDNTEQIITATRNPQIIRALGPGDILFDSLRADKNRGLISVFDCERKDKRLINYRTIVELLGYEGPEDSQVKVTNVIYKDSHVYGVEFGIMGEPAKMLLEDAFELIGMGICTNARIEKGRIAYSSVVPRIEYESAKYTDLETAKEIIKERVHYITTGEYRGDLTVVAKKKHKDLSKLIELLNKEYGYNIPNGVSEIQIEFK